MRYYIIELLALDNGSNDKPIKYMDLTEMNYSDLGALKVFQEITRHSYKKGDNTEAFDSMIWVGLQE